MTAQQRFDDVLGWHERAFGSPDWFAEMKQTCSLLPPEAQQFLLTAHATAHATPEDLGWPVVVADDGVLRLAPNVLRERVREGGSIRGRPVLRFKTARNGELLVDDRDRPIPILGKAFEIHKWPYLPIEIERLRYLRTLLELDLTIAALPDWEECFEAAQDLAALIRRRRRQGRLAAVEILEKALCEFLAQLPPGLHRLASTPRPPNRPALSPPRILLAGHLIRLGFSNAMIESRLGISARRVKELRSGRRQPSAVTLSTEAPAALDEAGPWLEQEINSLLRHIQQRSAASPPAPPGAQPSAEKPPTKTERPYMGV